MPINVLDEVAEVCADLDSRIIRSAEASQSLLAVSKLDTTYSVRVGVNEQSSRVAEGTRG